MLALQYACNEQGIKLPFKEAAALVDPKMSDGAVIQHFAKLRNRLADQGIPVVPPLRRRPISRATSKPLQKMPNRPRPVGFPPVNKAKVNSSTPSSPRPDVSRAPDTDEDPDGEYEPLKARGRKSSSRLRQRSKLNSGSFHRSLSVENSDISEDSDNIHQCDRYQHQDLLKFHESEDEGEEFQAYARKGKSLYKSEDEGEQSQACASQRKSLYESEDESNESQAHAPQRTPRSERVEEVTDEESIKQESQCSKGVKNKGRLSQAEPSRFRDAKLIRRRSPSNDSDGHVMIKDEHSDSGDSNTWSPTFCGSFVVKLRLPNGYTDWPTFGGVKAMGRRNNPEVFNASRQESLDVGSAFIRHKHQSESDIVRPSNVTSSFRAQQGPGAIAQSSSSTMELDHYEPRSTAHPNHSIQNSVSSRTFGRNKFDLMPVQQVVPLHATSFQNYHSGSIEHIAQLQQDYNRRAGLAHSRTMSAPISRSTSYFGESPQPRGTLSGPFGTNVATQNDTKACLQQFDEFLPVLPSSHILDGDPDELPSNVLRNSHDQLAFGYDEFFEMATYGQDFQNNSDQDS